MNKLMIIFLFAISSFFNNFAYADNHPQELPNVSNIQVNVCKLNDGVSLDEYNKVTQDYVKWSKKNDVETFWKYRQSINL